MICVLATCNAEGSVGVPLSAVPLRVTLYDADLVADPTPTE